MINEINTACEVMCGGGIILYPSDTTWGLGCDATNDTAVERVYSIKQRSENHPLLAIAGSLEQLTEYVDMPPEPVLNFINAFVTPLTIVYPKARNLAHNLTAADGSIGIRLTNEPFMKTLCLEYGKPVVSTSANISGWPAASHFRYIHPDIKAAVDYAFQYRRNDCMFSYPLLPSSVIRISDDAKTITVIR
ncbi:MAG: Sua5/YciO/YrdC/YwlC family protein [Tannerellaceae bacterium]|jgi:L-threonylcarbamoyladenylate synthase|nr:Sua5/YciO/YrdC/YwlC family protein [Tannerellaceae bacterium]